MSYFLHKKSKLWMGFNDIASSFNGEAITLSECSKCDEKLKPTNYVDSDKYNGDNDNEASNYLIKYNEQCVNPKENDNGSYGLTLGRCDANSVFIQNRMPEEEDESDDSSYHYNFLMVFRGHRVKDNNNKSLNRETLVSSKHKYQEVGGNHKHIYTLVSFDKISPTNAIAENIMIYGDVYQTIYEYRSDNPSILLKKTIYQLRFHERNELVIDNSVGPNIVGGIVYHLASVDEIPAMAIRHTGITYFGLNYIRRRGKKNPAEHDKRPILNLKNFNNAQIGVVINNTFNICSIDFSIYNGGIVVGSTQHNNTHIRAIPYDSIYNYEIKYIYNSDSIEDTQTYNLASGINPVKKINVKRNKSLKSKNMNDGASSRFKVVPSNIEGFTEQMSSSNESDMNELLVMIQNPNNIETFLEITKKCDALLYTLKTVNIGNASAHQVGDRMVIEYIKKCYDKASYIYADVKYYKDIVLQPDLKSLSQYDIKIIKHDISTKGITKRIKELRTIVDSPEHNYSTHFSKSMQKYNINLNSLKLHHKIIEGVMDFFIKIGERSYLDSLNEHMSAVYDSLEIINHDDAKTGFIDSIQVSVVNNLISRFSKMKNDFEVATKNMKDGSSFAGINILTSSDINKLNDVLRYYTMYLGIQKKNMIEHNKLVAVRENLKSINNEMMNSREERPKNIIEEYSRLIDTINIDDLKTTTQAGFFNSIKNTKVKMQSLDELQVNEAFVDFYSRSLYYYREERPPNLIKIPILPARVRGAVDRYNQHPSEMYEWMVSRLIRNYENQILNSFIEHYKPKYDELVNLIKAGQPGFSAQTINFEPFATNSNKEAFTNANKEAFTTASYFPSSPTPLNKNVDSELLEKAFHYADNSKLKSLSGYLQDTFENVSGYMCGDKTVDIALSYSILNQRYTYTGPINKFSVQSDSRCNFNKFVTIDYNLNDSMVRLNIRENDDIVQSIPIFGRIEKYEHCMTFGEKNDDKMTRIQTTISSSDKSTVMTYLESTSDHVNHNLKGSGALYSSDFKIRLILYNGVPKVQYIPPVSLSMSDKTNRYGVKDTQIFMYNNTDHLGKYLGKSIYIDPLGQTHSIGDEYKTKENSEYTDYKNYCIPSSSEYKNEVTSTVGDFHIDTNGPVVKIGTNNAKYLYPATNGSCDNDDHNGTMKLAKYPFDSKHRPCVTNASGVTHTNISGYGTPNHAFRTDDVCGLKQMLSSDVASFKLSRERFAEKFSDMIQAFNELSENELNMLKQTDTDIYSLQSIINEYQELYETASKNEKNMPILTAQVSDAKKTLINTEYTMAIAGIGAIGTLLIFLNNIKK